MASIDNYGLKALVTAFRICVLPNCDCTSNKELMREKVNKMLDPSHRLDSATYDAICHDLDLNPISERPETSTGEKQRITRSYDRVVEEAFKEFRDKEREIALNAPQGTCVVQGDVTSRRDDSDEDKFWTGAAHLRHHLELLLVLRGVKPCVLFLKYDHDNDPFFSTVVMDCLIPIMDRLDLWSYGFGISCESGIWVFYDARSPELTLVKKAFLTSDCVKNMNPEAYPDRDYPGTPDHETAQALGYPVPFDDWQSGLFVAIQDATELDVLARRGCPEDQRCCVPGMAFKIPEEEESAWKKVLDFHRKCVETAKSVGTELILFTDECYEMADWLEANPGILDGLSWVGG